MTLNCPDDCLVERGYYRYEPSLAGNIILSLYAVGLTGISCFLASHRGHPTLYLSLAAGSVLEFLGFLGRILMHKSSNSQTGFVLCMLGSLMGPIIMCAGIFALVFKHVTSHGKCSSRSCLKVAALSPAVLICAAGVVELVGLLMLAYHPMRIGHDTAANTTATGLALQAISLALGMAAYAWCNGPRRSPRSSSLTHESNAFGPALCPWFRRAAETSTVLHFVYCVYRVAELGHGPSKNPFQSQAAFMLLNGVLPLTACTIVLIFPPDLPPATSISAPIQLAKRDENGDPEQASPNMLAEAAHPRYDPNLRSKILASHSVDSPRPDHSALSGLPTNPRPGNKPTSSVSNSPQVTGDLVPDLPSQRHYSQWGATTPAKRDLVDTESLW